jgi:hypothetical protein
MKIIRVFFLQNCNFYFCPYLKGPWFGVGMFLFTGHRPETSKFVNTEYECNTSAHPGPDEGQIRTDLQPSKETDGFKKEIRRVPRGEGPGDV